MDKAMDIKRCIRNITIFNVLSIVLSATDSQVRWWLRGPTEAEIMNGSASVINPIAILVILQVIRLSNMSTCALSMYYTYHWFTC